MSEVESTQSFPNPEAEGSQEPVSEDTINLLKQAIDLRMDLEGDDNGFNGMVDSPAVTGQVIIWPEDIRAGIRADGKNEVAFFTTEQHSGTGVVEDTAYHLIRNPQGKLELTKNNKFTDMGGFGSDEDIVAALQDDKEGSGLLSEDVGKSKKAADWLSQLLLDEVQKTEASEELQRDMGLDKVTEYEGQVVLYMVNNARQMNEDGLINP